MVWYCNVLADGTIGALLREGRVFESLTRMILYHCGPNSRTLPPSASYHPALPTNTDHSLSPTRLPTRLPKFWIFSKSKAKPSWPKPKVEWVPRCLGEMKVQGQYRGNIDRNIEKCNVTSALGYYIGSVAYVTSRTDHATLQTSA